MGLFNLFACRRTADAQTERLPLTVLYAVDREGLSAKHGLALRDIVIAGTPMDFQFLNPGAFVVFYPGNGAGRVLAEQLSGKLKLFARDAELSNFGVGVEAGLCLVSKDASGTFTSIPTGEAVTRAMHTAIADADDVF